MIDERTELQAGLYALDALPNEEAREFEHALRRDAQLQQLVSQLRAAASALPLAFPRMEPPPALKRRLLAAIEKRGAGVVAPAAGPAWIPWALAACFAILCVALLALGHSIRLRSFAAQEQLDETRQKLAELEMQSDVLAGEFATRGSNFTQYLSVVQTQLVQRTEELKRTKQSYEQQLQQAGAETERQKLFYVRQVQQALAERDVLQTKLDGVTLPGDQIAQLQVAALGATPENPSRALGASAWDPLEQRGVLQVDNLRTLPPNSDYQLWLFDPQYARPVSGGAFSVEAGGAARVQYRAAARINQAQRFAVSIERKGGAQTPTPGRVVLISN